MAPSRRLSTVYVTPLLLVHVKNPVALYMHACWSNPRKFTGYGYRPQLYIIRIEKFGLEIPAIYTIGSLLSAIYSYVIIVTYRWNHDLGDMDEEQTHEDSL